MDAIDVAASFAMDLKVEAFGARDARHLAYYCPAFQTVRVILVEKKTICTLYRGKVSCLKQANR